MNGVVYELPVVLEDANERLDVFIQTRLSELTGDDFSRSRIQKMLENGAVTCRGERTVKNRRVRPGELFEVTVEPACELAAVAQNIPLDIVYEDGELLVVNKRKGMVVHPAAGNPDGTLVNALLYHCRGSLSGINGVLRPGIVHRIDKDTSGLLVVAKTDAAHRSLAAQIAEHSFSREYQAVVHGTIVSPGEVDAPIGRSRNDRKKFCVCDVNSKPARTDYYPIQRYDGFTHIGCRLYTGRTHQIRVHMSYINHPLAGDFVYGPKNTPKSLGGQCLHAGLLGFVHPATGQYVEFTAPLPDWFEGFIGSLRPREE